MDNILALHNELVNKSYQHGGYKHFKISDPKPRDIHKAPVRDRLVHHAIYRILYPCFDQKFIADSYSCRTGKGTHKALNRFRQFAYKVSQNHTRTCWVLKCDIKKFFASIDHAAMLQILCRHISDPGTIWLLDRVIGSFSTDGKERTGLPLGNLTSQLLVNIYMNEFDQFAKHKLKARHYVRYADDFVFLSDNLLWLQSLIPRIKAFLGENLKLQLHPDKVFIKTIASGVDFLGWVHFPDHRLIRPASRRRIAKRLLAEPSEATKASCLGLLQHGNTQRFLENLEKE